VKCLTVECAVVIDQQLEENATTHHRERTARRARLASTSEQFA
jgi:hypothetical protein